MNGTASETDSRAEMFDRGREVGFMDRVRKGPGVVGTAQRNGPWV